MKSCPKKVSVYDLDKEWFDREEEDFEKNGGCKSLLQKNEKKPKKCLSGYMIFVREMRP